MEKTTETTLRQIVQFNRINKQQGQSNLPHADKDISLFMKTPRRKWLPAIYTFKGYNLDLLSLATHIKNKRVKAIPVYVNQTKCSQNIQKHKKPYK